MSKKWLVVLSNGTTREVVSPAMRVCKVDDEDVARPVDGERVGACEVADEAVRRQKRRGEAGM